jgi:hypothetical protein
MAIPGGRPPARARCGACNGPIESMGPVRLDLARMGTLTTCDARCTMASGPSCNCQCQGANHGTGIRVGVAVQSGGLVRVTPPHVERAQRIAREWAEALREVRARVDRHYPEIARVRRGEQVNPFAATRAKAGIAILDRVAAAETMRAHPARLQAISKINDTLTEAAR